MGSFSEVFVFRTTILTVLAGLDNALRVFGLHKDVHMNMELSQGVLNVSVHVYYNILTLGFVISTVGRSSGQKVSD